MVLSMLPSKIKIDKDKTKHVILAQQNGFGPLGPRSCKALCEGCMLPPCKACGEGFTSPRSGKACHEGFT